MQPEEVRCQFPQQGQIFHAMFLEVSGLILIKHHILGLKTHGRRRCVAAALETEWGELFQSVLVGIAQIKLIPPTM